MKNFIMVARRSILGLFFLGGTFVSSVAVADGCIPISSVPVTITVPGTYCLTSDLDFQNNVGIAIGVQTDDVTLDFKGHELKGAGNNNMRGVDATGRSNIIVRNGQIINTWTGINVGRNSIVENMVVTNISQNGVVVNPASNSIIRNNVISNIVPVSDIAVTGILVLSCVQGGKAVRVTGNVVSGFARFNSKLAVGIESRACYGIIEENSINGELTSDYGIHITYAGQHLIRGNNFTGGMHKEVVCGYFAGTVKYKDNISTSPYDGKYDCFASGDLGGNF